eukprot:CAMPEP_0171931880 /NCGR_PEP_ID=MMETSP0993-20121228/29839_1 /TAXON_ID=483369 /ORGANISM="non described non described, Strain CCMP2098" /LENGTH=431 /DNA_ID=CAMNT_0012572015 /DNA_START=200 /DNA_END=1494 /DNA_ORIENTATION=-
MTLKYHYKTGKKVTPRKLFLWTGGGSGGMGNTFVGFMTSFYDAMRSGRRLVMLSTPEFTFSDLSVAFELDIPIVENSIEFDQSHRKQTYPEAHFAFDPARPADQRGNVTFMLHRKPAPAAEYPVIQSRHHNVHFSRPKQRELLACHFAALGCTVSPLSSEINILKQQASVAEYCGETSILRRLVKGLSSRVHAVSGLYEETWSGSNERIKSLFSARSSPLGLPPLPPLALAHSRDPQVQKTYRNYSAPLWDCAIHVRVGFKFVELGGTEEQHAAEIDEWLSKPGTHKALQELVGQVRARLAHPRAPEGSKAKRITGVSLSPPVVYIASETSRVREHVAKLIREASSSPVECEFFSWSGTPHPVDIDGNHRSDSGQDSKPQIGSKEDADLLFPYLEWWALAHSRFILVRRGLDLKPVGSTFSATAHLYGGWS